MAWRSILIQNPARLSLSKGQFNLDNEEGNFTLPLEDITCIILESPQITISSALLSAAQSQNIVIVTCDHSHTPNGLLLPFQQHSRQSRIAHIQIAWSDALKKRLWQAVIKNKINGQAKCLEIFEGREKAQRLYALSKRVNAGDNNNIEAQAARDYWQRLFGKNFKRGANDQINAALNYTYSVLRAHIARAQVSYGLLPSFGIHHNNQLNAFNLTDDFIEVFRPFADKMVKSMLNDGEIDIKDGQLSTTLRQKLASISNEYCMIGGQKHTIGNGCDKIAAGLVNAIEHKSVALLPLPSFLDKENL